ncbi:MAG TPA: CrcB family protein [bacterium]|nr:CrcB family protein [bacterium]
MHLSVVLAVAGAGALGATSRYLLTLALRVWLGAGHWPIAVVNVLGCFGFGLCWALATGRMSHPVAVAVLAGFFGAFTTFSAFALDGQQLLAAHRPGMFLLNLLLQNGLGLLALWGGMLVGGLSTDGARW